MAKGSGKKGCLWVLLIGIILIGGGGFLGWKMIFDKSPNAEAQKVISGPVDAEATRILTKAFETSKVGSVKEGIGLVVVPLPDGSGNGAVISLDSDSGFKPAPGSEGKRKQAMTMIAAIVKANSKSHLELKSVGVTYSEAGKNIIGLGCTMADLEAFHAGKLKEEAFIGKVKVSIQDVNYFRTLLGSNIGGE